MLLLLPDTASCVTKVKQVPTTVQAWLWCMHHYFKGWWWATGTWCTHTRVKIKEHRHVSVYQEQQILQYHAMFHVVAVSLTCKLVLLLRVPGTLVVFATKWLGVHVLCTCAWETFCGLITWGCITQGQMFISACMTFFSPFSLCSRGSNFDPNTYPNFNCCSYVYQ